MIARVERNAGQSNVEEVTMNLLKSMFMTAYLMMTMAVSGYAAWMLYQGGVQAQWLGVMLTTAPFMIVLMGLMMLQNVTRTSRHMALLQVMALAGVGLAAAKWLSEPGAEALALALSGWVGLLLYVYWYSDFGRMPSMKLVIGAPLPEFRVMDGEGRALSSRALAGKPSVLVFYRGNWCPFCMAQVKELVARYRELDELGIRVAFISPQPYAKNVQLAEKYNVNFEFLTDEDNAAARILQIDQKNGLPSGMQMMGYDSDTVLPTVIVTDKDGKVLWVHETDSYRVRPEPDVYLDVLRRHGIVRGVRTGAAFKPSVV